MTVVRLTITMPEDLASYIRDQVEQGRYDSVSAFLTQAASTLRDVEPLDLLIASMIAESGEPDEATIARVDHAMAVALLSAEQHAGEAGHG